MVYTVDGVNYTRRGKIIVTGAGSGAQTDFQIKLTTIWAKAMQADFDDARFTKADMQTLIDAWLESKTDSTTADIWAEFPTTPANTVEQTYYMYYGNAVAASDWDIGATFILGDDFADGNYTSDPTWTPQEGTWSAADYYLKKTAANGWDDISTPSTSTVAVWEYKANTGYVQQFFFMGTTATQTSSNGYMVYLACNINQIRLYKTSGGAHAEIASAALTCGSGWHDVKITRDSSGEFKIYYDDVLKITHTDNTYSSSSYIIQNANYQNTDQIDDIRVRKYAANPPTAAFGTEEHQRRTPMMM